LAGLSLLGIFFLHKRHRKVQKLQRQAAEQLEKFKAELISKNEHLEELITSLQEHQNRQMDTQRMEELSRQMILTDDDWQNFKQLFEQTYPSFFNQLKVKAPGITEAEQRMAALIRIQLNTKQVASMQGISADSVHKTRQRLRLRFGTDSTVELENIIATI
jgi:DNA-binding CsgD family transcriptional regulator